MSSVQRKIVSDSAYSIPSKGAIRTLDRRIHSQARASIYKAAAFATQKISKGKSSRYKLLSEFYRTRALAAKEARGVFGGNLINYGLNFERKKTLGKTPDPAKVRKVFDRANSAKPTHYELKNPRKISKEYEGLCHAACASCIKKFYQYREEGLSDSEAFYKASSHYKEGMSEKVALARSVSQHKVDKRKKLAKERQIAQTLPSGYIADSSNMLKLKSEDSFFAKIFNLTVKEHEVMSRRNLPRSFLKAPPGVYMTSLMDAGNFNNGHVIMLVKNRDGSIFIFDPSFGAAIVPKHEAQDCLKRLVNHRLYGGAGRAAFVPIEPA